MPDRQIRSPCDLMADAIKFIKQEIKTKEARILTLTERLRKLQSQPDPDPEQVQQIKADLQELENQLETSDRPQLTVLEEDFAAFCR